MKYYVKAGCSGGKGTAEEPFGRIQQAADIAVGGDEVIVASGIYRESVSPVNAGTEDARIVYTSSEPGGAVITGSEPVSGWEPVEGAAGVWKAVVSNSMFTDRNPFTTLISGDWFIASKIAHTGDVFLNGRSMYEVMSLDAVKKSEVSDISWEPEYSVYTWFAEQDEEANSTIIYANFQELDPGNEAVEISCRKNCFYPEEEGVGYITVRGFKLCNAATQWAPPTAYQEGLIGPHWSRGWIIEDCEIFESKCSGISLGKCLQEDNDNKWLKWKYKDGTQTERDCIMEAVNRNGWCKERVGSHIVRRCHIHDCGQTGIVGHLGGVFSVIENNHIHNINNKQNLAGAEIGGIKMHAAIDTVFRHNHIHHCTRGLWLDWQAQGTRVTGNLFHDNSLINVTEDTETDSPKFVATGEDIFVEVSHGPTLIDNNVLLSDRSLKLCAQGIAVVNNLIAGGLVGVGIGTDNGAKTLSSSRYTPYHVKHETAVAGFMTFLHGDMRFYNNIFVQGHIRESMKRKMEECKAENNMWDDNNIYVGTAPYDSYPTNEEWEKLFEGYCGMGSEPSDRYYTHLPVWMGGNVYLNGALRWKKELEFEENKETEARIELAFGADGWYLNTNLNELLSGKKYQVQGTKTLGMAFEPEQNFEASDGSAIELDTDILGNRSTDGTRLPGPLASYDATVLKLGFEV